MKQFLNVFTALICSILTIILYLVVVSFLSVVMCRGLISEEGIKEITDEVDILSFKATGILANEELTDATIKDVIVSKATSQGVSEVLVLQVLEDPKFNQIINQFLTDYSNYILDDGVKPEIDQEAINELIVTSRDSVKEQTGYVIPDSQLNELTKIANDFALEINNSIPLKEQIVDNGADQVFELIYSNWFIFISICTIILILLAFMLFCFSVIAPLIWGGIAFIMSGSTLTVIAVLKSFVTSIVNQYDNVYSSVFKAISGGLFKNIYFYGIGVLLLGILMVIIYNVLKKKKLKD